MPFLGRTCYNGFMNKQKKPGHYVAIGMALGAGIGSALSVPLDNFGVGIGSGVAIGLVIGMQMEQRAKEKGKVRELTEEEKLKNKRHEKYFSIGLGVFILSIIAVAFLFYF